GVCTCGQPYLVRYRATPAPEARARLAERRWTMWRYREWLPLADGEAPVTLGEGGTPLLAVPRVAAKHGVRELRVREEGANPARDPRPDPQLRRGPGAGGRSHRRLRKSGPRVRGRNWGRRRVHVTRALPHRGQEDAGPRARGAARLESARCDRVLHGGRHRTDRHVESVRRTHARRLARRQTAAPVQRPGRGVRTGRQGLRGRDRRLRPLARPTDDRRGVAGPGATRRSLDAPRAAGVRRWRGGGDGRAPRRGGPRPPDARGPRRVAGGRGRARRRGRAPGGWAAAPRRTGGDLQHWRRVALPGLTCLYSVAWNICASRYSNRQQESRSRWLWGRSLSSACGR